MDRSRPRRSAALLLVTVLAACGDPAAPTAAPRPVALSEAAAVRMPAAVRYRDAGRKPATGRSGSATLQARALLSRDGSTLLEVTTGSLDEATPAPGEISHLQVKWFSPTGDLMSVANTFPGAPSVAVTVPGLVRGDTVQVQGNVRGIDGSRTDVVTVVAPVLRRPNLRASDLLMPDEAIAGVPVAIAATIREMNGDVGAHADCALYVDGARADVAPDIWVDAGDAVSCAFSHTFAAPPGVHTVTVRVEHARPYDDDPSDDAVSGAIQVNVEIPDAFDWTASARDAVTAIDDSSYERIAGGSSGTIERWSGTHRRTREQAADFAGTTARAVAFPIRRLELGQWTNGAAVHHVVIDGVPATATTGGTTCGGGDLAAGESFTVCTASGARASTEVRYLRRAGSVTYQSANYARDWYRDESGAPYYVANATSSGDSSFTGAPVVDYGPSYRFLVRLNDGGWIYIQDATVPLGSFERVLDERPWGCGGFALGTLSLERCGSHRETVSGREGERSAPAARP